MRSGPIKLYILISSLFILLAPQSGNGESAYEDPATGMEFVFIKGGCYQMGSEDGGINERPVHKTCVGDFFMARYEVTQKQWTLIMGSNPSFFKNCGDQCPVENVSWVDAHIFISRLNEKAGTNGYRLPTEAEWEYAARAGSRTRYSFGDDDRGLGDYAWYASNSGSSTDPEVYYNNRLVQTHPHPVGQKKSNAWGLYDMQGNVWEWVHDWYGLYLPGDAQNPTGPRSGSSRVYRGGSWDSSADLCRPAKRFVSYPLATDADRGFRIVKLP